MTYEYWEFNGIQIRKVLKSSHSKSKGTITLNCAAPFDNMNDPRTIIAAWKMYESIDESRTPSLGGSVGLQTTGAGSFVLASSLQRFQATLVKVTSSLDEFFNDPIMPLLLFDLEFSVGDVDVYDEYGKKYVVGTTYSNLLYGGSHVLGEDLGIVKITEQYPISHVDVYGYGANLPSYVEVNGKRKFWHYKLGEQVEKLTWTLPPGTLEVDIQSLAVNHYYASTIRAICTFPNENIDIVSQAFEGV